MARKQNKRWNPPATQRGRSPSGGAGGREDRGRWSSRRKAEIVMRILKGEQLDGLSRELGVSTARLAAWRDEFFAGGQAALMSREPDARDQEIQRLKAKVGDQTMTIELLEEKIRILEDGLGPQPRRPKT
jgi:transposase-like protein